MLKLDRIDISGFKSFVDPVHTEFAEGITAIVGPNGCGKSNLSEAITWVLGEQSAKTLRGGSMEDVIFNGTDRRKPLGMAEVSLTLATDEALDWAESGRITIGRRVFRSGESQYRINDRLVRLKDIKDMLADTGLGVRAYAVIEQGKIGQILSSKPLERRKLIEEAAGITRYKSRKRLAELKLEEATANRMRLDDIIAEIDRQLRVLKRQANAAVRFRERSDEYRQLLRQVLSGRWGRMCQEQDTLAAAILEAATRDAQMVAALKEREGHLAQAREDLEDRNRELATRHQRLAELGARIEGRQQFGTASARTLEELHERLFAGENGARERGDELLRQEQERAELTGRHLLLVDEHGKTKTGFEAGQALVLEAIAAYSAVEGRHERLRNELMTSLAQLNAVQNRVHRAQIDEEKARYRCDHVQQNLVNKTEAIAAADAEFTAADLQVGSVENELSKRAAGLLELRAALEQRLAAERRASETRETATRQVDELRRRQDILDEFDRTDDNRRQKLVHALAQLGIDQPRFLEDIVSIPEGFESGVDVYLEGLRDAVLVPLEEDALELARQLAARDVEAVLLRAINEPSYDPMRNLQRPSNGNGAPDGIRSGPNSSAQRRSLWQWLLSPFRRERMEPSEPDEPPAGFVTSLGEALGLPPEFARALPPAALVETPDDAGRLAARHPGIAFISRDRVWTLSGMVRVQSDSANPGALARASERAAIGEQLPGAEAQLEQAAARIADLAAARSELAALSHRVDGEIQDLRQTQAVATARRQDLRHRRDRLFAEQKGLDSEREQANASLAQIIELQKRLDEERNAARARHQELEKGFDEHQTTVEEARQRREQLQTEGAARKGAVRVLDERLAAHQQEVQRLQASENLIREALGAWAQERERLSSRIAELESAMTAAEQELVAAKQEQTQAQQERDSTGERLEQQRLLVRDLEHQVLAARTSREEHQSQLQELRVSDAAGRQRAEHLQATFRQEFQEQLPTDPADRRLVPENLDELEIDSQRLKETLDRMGPVNVLAAEEYDEQEKRLVFLSEQRADVQKSMDSLRKTIREINETSRERFVSAFEEVNKNFALTFAQLFSGGEASMSLLDEEDPLESGIEIVARPPGKRLQNIQLMSGGEKALTAIALLFALFRYKPSPFCILDEVDAPLDDANVLRFIEMLREMAKDTQFLVVTHNKLTMEAASSLYGVTMVEKGVTKLVGVDLDDLHPQQMAS